MRRFQETTLNVVIMLGTMFAWLAVYALIG